MIYSSKHDRTRIIPLVMAVVGLSSTSAYGQMIDYGSAQALFGEPVTTSVTGTPQRASDVPANMTIITADEIRQSGSRSIPEILSRVPGLDILRSSATIYDVGVRGYQQPFQPRLLVLIDGRQVFNDDYSRTEWNNLPVNVDDIRQIEVVKGAASALFGSNAAGGVVNIVTYNPLYDKSRTANLSFGTQNTKSGDATFTEHLGGFEGIKLSAGGMGGDNFDTPKLAYESGFNDKPQHQYLSASSVSDTNTGLKTNLEVTYSNSQEAGADLGYNIQNSTDTNYSLRGGFSWETPYGLIVNDNYFNHNYELADFVLTPHLNSLVDLFVSKLEDQFRLGNDNTFRLALETRRKSINQSASDNMVPQNNEVDDNIYAVSGTWLWQINDKLSWTNAARIDHSVLHEGGTLDQNSVVTDYNNSLNAFSGNSGLVYHATSADTFRATIGQGIQLPSMIQNGVSFAVPIIGGVVINSEGNPHLKPTVVDNYELGYERKVPDIFSTADFSIFYETNKDLVAYPIVVGAPRFINGTPWILTQAENIGDSHGVGSEVELKGNSPAGFRWDTSYSWASVADAATLANTLDYKKSTPESHFRLLLGYTTGPWEFDANGQLVTSTDMLRLLSGQTPTGVPVAGYTSLSARIGYNITDNYTIALSGTNLTRADTQENPYPAIERQVFLGLTGKF